MGFRNRIELILFIFVAILIIAIVVVEWNYGLSINDSFDSLDKVTNNARK